MKSLIKKFSFYSLMRESAKQGWSIPSMEEVKASDIEHNIVWVNDVPEDPNDWETHACLYDKRNDRLEVCNKSHMHTCVVLKSSKTYDLPIQMAGDDIRYVFQVPKGIDREIAAKCLMDMVVRNNKKSTFKVEKKC